ncbi:MAG: DMP19 family protein [Fluviicola sp.]|nr:DMP19 family protein [Fluviicola sp.]
MTRIKHLETLLSSDDTNGSIIELDNFIGELCSYGDEMDTLTEPQKLFYYIQCLEREVNNGGFNQYFINSSGEYAHQTIESLKRIGANTTADILQKAIDQFPEKKVPQDRDERNELVEQIEATANEVWNELDQQFYEYADDLNALNINFVKELKEFF